MMAAPTTTNGSWSALNIPQSSQYVIRISLPYRWHPGEAILAHMDMRDVVTQAIVLLQMAERAGFHSAWSAEHHTIELTIAPNPFSFAHLLGATHQPDQTRHRGGYSAVLAPDSSGR